MPIATPSKKWSYSCHESHILPWRFTKRQVGIPYECWLLQASGNCWTGSNLVHHPFWIEAEGIVDVLEGNGIHCRWIMAPSGSGELRRLPVRQQDFTAFNKHRLACQGPLA